MSLFNYFRMKKITIVFTVFVLTLSVFSCTNNTEKTGTTYMPDMAYSRAYETYATTENLRDKGINYNATPVQGTVARGDMPAYIYKNDSLGYANSKNVKNPLSSLDEKDYLEASRLFLVNCAICHGDKLDGNGPLWKTGDGPFPAAPRNLISDPIATAMAEGTMFHSVTYGKNMMGSFISQLSTKQRWMIVYYIKEKQRLASVSDVAQN